MRKYYTLKQKNSARGAVYNYKAFDEMLNEVNSKDLNPKITEDEDLVEIVGEDHSRLSFYDNNVFIGEIDGKRYFAFGSRVDGAATSAAKNI